MFNLMYLILAVRKWRNYIDLAVDDYLSKYIGQIVIALRYVK